MSRSEILAALERLRAIVRAMSIESTHSKSNFLSNSPSPLPSPPTSTSAAAASSLPCLLPSHPPPTTPSPILSQTPPLFLSPPTPSLTYPFPHPPSTTMIRHAPPFPQPLAAPPPPLMIQPLPPTSLPPPELPPPSATPPMIFQPPNTLPISPTAIQPPPIPSPPIQPPHTPPLAPPIVSIGASSLFFSLPISPAASPTRRCRPKYLLLLGNGDDDDPNPPDISIVAVGYENVDDEPSPPTPIISFSRLQTMYLGRLIEESFGHLVWPIPQKEKDACPVINISDTTIRINEPEYVNVSYSDSEEVMSPVVKCNSKLRRNLFGNDAESTTTTHMANAWPPRNAFPPPPANYFEPPPGFADVKGEDDTGSSCFSSSPWKWFK